MTFICSKNHRNSNYRTNCGSSFRRSTKIILRCKRLVHQETWEDVQRIANMGICWHDFMRSMVCIQHHSTINLVSKSFANLPEPISRKFQESQKICPRRPEELMRSTSVRSSQVSWVSRRTERRAMSATPSSTFLMGSDCKRCRWLLFGEKYVLKNVNWIHLILCALRIWDNFGIRSDCLMLLCPRIMGLSP